MVINEESAEEYSANLGNILESGAVSVEEQTEGASTTALKKTGGCLRWRPSVVSRHDTVFEERGYTGTSLETDERKRT